MRRVIALISALVVCVSMFAVSAAAVTKADLLAEAAKSPVYKYVQVAVENAARTVEVTDEQAEALLPIVQKAVSILSVDKGPNFASYNDIDKSGLIACIDDACAILGLTYTLNVDANEFKVFNSNGQQIFEYDANPVADTDAAAADAVMILCGAVALLVAGAAVLAVSKRRIAAR